MVSQYTTIQVVDVRRNLLDLYTASEEDLIVILNELELVPELSGMGASLYSFIGLSKFIRRFAYIDIQSALPSIKARILIANPSIRPIVLNRGVDIENNSETSINTRPESRIRCIDERNYDMSYAAEESVNITGFAIDPHMSGLLLNNLIGNGYNIGLDALLKSGSYTSAMYMLRTEVISVKNDNIDYGDEKLNSLAKKGFDIKSLKDIEKIAFQIRETLNLYLSGAAAHIISYRILSAVEGLPHALPNMRDLFKRDMNVLNSQYGVIKSSDESKSSTWREVANIARIQYLVERLSHSSPIVSTADTWKFDLNALNDLYRIGSLNTIYYVFTEGRDSPTIALLLDQAISKNIIISHLNEMWKISNKSQIQARQYVMIIKDKFGTTRSDEILNLLRSVGGSITRAAPGGTLAATMDSIQVNDPDALIKILTKDEKRIVELEYNNRMESWKSFIDNKCPHVKILSKLNSNANSKILLNALQDLEQYYLPQIDPISWLQCKNCNFQIICPHLVDKIKMEATKTPFSVIKKALMKYSDNKMQKKTEYCVICNGQLVEKSDDDIPSSSVNQFGDLNSHIRTRIWSIAINAVKHVRFSIPTDDRQFANTAVAILYPLIIRTEDTLEKKRNRRKIEYKTDEVEQVDPRMSLYIVIFIYAYILDLISNSHIHNSSIYMGLEGVKDGAKISIYAEQMLRIIAADYNTIIMQVQDISIEFIKDRFMEAYKMIRNESSSFIQAANVEEEFVIQLTTINHTYGYAVKVAKILGDLPIEQAKGPSEAKREFELVMGESLPELIRLARERSKDFDIKSLYSKRIGAEIPAGSSIEFMVKDPRINLYAKIYEPVVSEETFALYHKANPSIDTLINSNIRSWMGGKKVDQPEKNLKSKYINESNRFAPYVMETRSEFIESYKLFVDYTKNTTTQAKQDLYLNKIKEYRMHETRLSLNKAYDKVKSYYDFKYINSNQYTTSSSTMSSIYDELGRPHDYNKNPTYHYGDGVNLNIDLIGVNSVIKARVNDTLTSNMKLIDVSCGICGVKSSERDKLDIVKVTNAVKAIYEISSLFLFYNTKCPEKDSHQWNDARTCIKCGISVLMQKDAMQARHDNEASIYEYYHKYSAQFNIDRSIQKRTEKIITMPEKVFEFNWAPDYTLIVRISELMSVKTTLIEAIGNMAGRKYEDILNGVNIPSTPTLSSDDRLYKVDAEVRLFLYDYSILRNIWKNTKPPIDVINLLNLSGVPTSEYKNIQSVLVDVGDDYHRKFAKLCLVDPAKAFIFAIQSICRISLDIIKENVTDPPWGKTLKTLFVKKEIELILRNQRLFAKPGAFNWSIFETGEDLDESVDIDIRDVGEDIVNKASPEDAYSGEGMDYDLGEDNPNNEP